MAQRTLSYSFERALQSGEFLFKNVNIARIGTSSTVVWVHFRALNGPSGLAGSIQLLDDPSSPLQTVLLVIANTSGNECDQEFDSGGFGGATLMAPMLFTPGSGRKLSAKVLFPAGLEGPGVMMIGVQDV